jgi:hypothetical protein
MATKNCLPLQRETTLDLPVGKVLHAVGRKEEGYIKRYMSVLICKGAATTPLRLVFRTFVFIVSK